MDDATTTTITTADVPTYDDINDDVDVDVDDLRTPSKQRQRQQQPTPMPTPGGADDNDEESEDFLDRLDEVHTRFILNVPPEELGTSERIFFQLEQAWWYYEDMICDKLEEEMEKQNNGGGGVCPLPRFSNLKAFAKRLFRFSPLLRDLEFGKLWKEFGAYKRKISTYGCILLNEACTHLVLCKFYKSDVWTFPSGKINQNEIGIDAAAREVYEETGFDPHCTLGGLTKEWVESSDAESSRVTWHRPLRDPEDSLTYVEQPSGKRRTMYVCCGVPEDFPFEPVCRKEIDVIEWVDLRDIKEYKSFAVLPFVGKLKKWIKHCNRRKQQQQQQQPRSDSKKKDRRNKSRAKSREKSAGRDGSSGRDRSSRRQQRRNSSRKKDRELLVEGGLIGSMGESTRWTEEEMFETNSKLMGGRIVAYDGNPHAFAEKGFGIESEAGIDDSQRIDPHSFRVVGGSFMNSTHGDKLERASNSEAMASRYQPLVRDAAAVAAVSTSDGGVAGLQPFFSQQGATPWGDVVDEAKSDSGDGPVHHGGVGVGVGGTIPGNDDENEDHHYDGFAGDEGYRHSAGHSATSTTTSTNTNTNTNEKATRDLLSMLRIDGNHHHPIPRSVTAASTVTTTTTIPVASSPPPPRSAPVSGDYSYDDDEDDANMMIFATDKEITAKRQRDHELHKRQQQEQERRSRSSSSTTDDADRKRASMIAKHDEDMAFVRDWVDNLPNPTGFVIPGVDAILRKHYGEEAFRSAVEARERATAGGGGVAATATVVR